MDIGSIFLILALFVLVVLFLARPFFENRSKSVTREEHDISSLLAERDRIITALQELDFDFALQKIPEDEYPAQRANLLARGSDILRQLDQLEPAAADGSAEERIESAIAARRADLSRSRQSTPAGTAISSPAGGVAVAVGGNGFDDELEAQIAARRRAREGKASGFCPQCGGPVHKTDKFCSRCGAIL